MGFVDCRDDNIRMLILDEWKWSATALTRTPIKVRTPPSHGVAESGWIVAGRLRLATPLAADSVAVDSAGNVYVADAMNHRIQKFGLTIVNDPTIEVDIKPWSCVNPLNVRSRGVLPVAILGSEVFDVRDIDTRTIRLSSDGTELEVRPIRGRYEDVSTSFEGELYDCQGAPDGLEDLILKFRTQDVVRAIGKVNHGEEVVLTITGTLVDQITEFEGTDSVKIIKKRKKNKYPKKNKRRKK